MREYDIVILGSGISGLSLAHYAAQRGLRTLVIESSNRVGGTLHTHHFKNDATDFWIELGAHTCYNSYASLIGILEDLDMIDQLVPRQKVPFRMLVGNQIKSIPSQINFLELLVSVPRGLFLDKRQETVESYYSRIVGKRNYEKVFSHAFDAVPSQRTNDFPADILFKKRQRRKDVLRSYTFRQGLQSVTDRIAAQPGVDIVTGNEAVEIRSATQRFTTVTRNNESYESTYLAMATPVVDAARLMQPVNPQLADELSRIDVVRFESVGVAVEQDRLALERVAGLVPGADSFYSAVSRDTVAGGAYRGFTFHFKPDQVDQKARLKRIGEILNVPPDSLQRVAIRKNTLPSFRLGHRDWVKKIDALIAGQKLLLTGNYLSGVAIEDCVSRSLSEARRIQIGA